MPALPGTRCRRRIYLMRHGQAAYFDAAGRPLRPREAALTETGVSQAQAAGELLRGVPFDLALCSGLVRARDTARLALGGREMAIGEEPRFEEIRSGRLRELPAETRERTIVHAYTDAPLPSARFIGGELWVDFQSRVLAGWRTLLARNDWVNVLLVAHDAVNRVLLAHIAGAGLQGLKAFEQDPACVNLIEVDVEEGNEVGAHIRALNMAAYDFLRHGHHMTVMELVYRAYRPEA